MAEAWGRVKDGGTCTGGEGGGLGSRSVGAVAGWRVAVLLVLLLVLLVLLVLLGWLP